MHIEAKTHRTIKIFPQKNTSSKVGKHILLCGTDNSDNN